MVYAVAILLVSALTSVGLLALWAATSKSHWFWRTMLFLAAISPLLLIPAYEPFLAFVLQGAVIAAGVQLSRWRSARKRGEPFFKSRFSLRTILFVAVPLSIVATAIVRAPELNWPAWQSLWLIGFTGGLASLAGWWMAFGTSDNWRVRFLLTAMLLGVISLIVANGDWFVFCIENSVGWPPVIEYVNLFSIGGNHALGDPEFVWIPITMAISIVTGICIFLFHLESNSRPISILASILCFMITAVAVAPAAITYLDLMNPLPIPVAQLPERNGYDDFLKAGELLPANPLVNDGNFDVETATEQELEQAASEMAPSFNFVREGIKFPTMVQLQYTMDDLPTIGDFRTIVRGFQAAGKLAEKRDNFDQAVDFYFDGARFGVLLSHGGLMVNDLVGVACTGVCCRGLYECSKLVSLEKLPRVIDQLEQLQTFRDPVEDVIHRDRVWGQRALGWYGHLLDIGSEILEEDSGVQDSYREARNRELAILCLLQLELALRFYKAEHTNWPDTLDELTHKYIDAIPVDPFSPEGHPMRYARTGDDYILYSVGKNLADDGGVAATDDGSGYRDPHTGDLRLDVFFAD